MSELALQQINAKCDVTIALLQRLERGLAGVELSEENDRLIEKLHIANVQIRKLRRTIYRAVDHNEAVLIDRNLMQEIIAEFEPNEG